MKTTIVLALVVLFSFSLFARNAADTTDKKEDNLVNISSFYVFDANKAAVNLDTYKGKVLLIVNVASKCGFTPQYEGLEKLYEKFKDRGFEILAFPCNDFGEQEPGTNEEIKTFCTSKYGVKFQIFDKIKILGDDQLPLYSSLTGSGSVEPGDVKWNFEKFLIDKDGNLVARFRSKVTPLDDAITAAIEKQLAK